MLERFHPPIGAFDLSAAFPLRKFEMPVPQLPAGPPPSWPPSIDQENPYRKSAEAKRGSVTVESRCGAVV